MSWHSLPFETDLVIFDSGININVDLAFFLYLSVQLYKMIYFDRWTVSFSQYSFWEVLQWSIAFDHETSQSDSLRRGYYSIQRRSNDELLWEMQLWWQNGRRWWCCIQGCICCLLDRVSGWYCSRSRCEGAVIIPKMVRGRMEICWNLLAKGLKDHGYFPFGLAQAFSSSNHIW